jgi:predicted nucleic acid-binding protein
LNACVLDTDVVIAALDRSDPHHRVAAKCFGRFEEAGAELLICSVNYAEALVRPAEDEHTLRVATRAIAALGIRVQAPDARIARLAATRRRLGISLADGFAIATAERAGADVASFDRRVRRALRQTDVALAAALG